MTQEQKKFYDIKKTKTSEYKVAGEDVQYKIIVDDDNKEVILQFEESNSKQDWLHNFQWLPFPLRLDNKHDVWVTKGFACAYSSTEFKPINEFILEVMNYQNYKTIIRGWSFGSAMAKIATLDYFYITGVPIDELTTYGDVKCFLNPFIKKQMKKSAKSIHEYCCINDFVTWGIPLYHRTHKCKVGGKFSFKKIFNTEYTHTHYEEYDYSEYEK